MSNGRVAKRIRKARDAEAVSALRVEAHGLGIRSNADYIVWLTLVEGGWTGAEAKKQMDEWKAEQAADLCAGMIGRFFA